MPAIVNIQNEDRWRAEVCGLTTNLASAEFGSAQILAKPEGTGNRFCLVRIGNDVPATPTWGRVIDDWDTGDTTIDVHPCLPDGTKLLMNFKDEQFSKVCLGTVVSNSADSPYFRVNALSGPDAGSQVMVYVNWQNGISQSDKFGALGTNARTGQVIAFEYVKFAASFNRTPDYYCQCLTDVRDDLIAGDHP